MRAIADDVQGLVTDASTRGIGFLVAANQEGGRIEGLSGPGFDTIPSALAQGRWTPAKLEANAAAWGSQLLNAGINVDLAPVADVVPPGTDAKNAPIGKLKRAFGHDPGDRREPRRRLRRGHAGRREWRRPSSTSRAWAG